MQFFVPFEPEQHYFTLQERYADAFRAVALFDLVVNNADRKGGHCLLGEDGRIWLIDHGVCFSAEPKLRTVIWEYMDEPIPPAAARRAWPASASALDGRRAGARRARRPAERGGAGGLCGRIETLESHVPVFPGPGGDRPFPWPPV